MGGMAGLLSLTSTTWTLTVAVLLSGGFPLSAACRISLGHNGGKIEIMPLWTTFHEYLAKVLGSLDIFHNFTFTINITEIFGNTPTQGCI